MSMNPIFFKKMKELLKEEYDDFIACLEKPQQKAIFVNSCKISPERFVDIADFSLEKIHYEKCGFSESCNYLSVILRFLINSENDSSLSKISW